jgi:hypothetical protein
MFTDIFKELIRVGQMQPPDPDQDPAFAAFLHQVADRMEATWRAQGVVVPAGVCEQFWRVAFDYLREHPLSKPNTFYDFSGSRLMTIVQQLERELSGGHVDPAFTAMFARRLRDAMDHRDSRDS